VIGVYTASITLLSIHETDNPALQRIIKQMLLGVIVVDAAIAWLSPFGDPLSALLVLSLLVPAVALGRAFAMT
jgi:hypothetical protein